MSFEIAQSYRDACTSFIDFYEQHALSHGDVAVPCTPLWTVRDVLSHAAGLADDITNGNIDGAATEPWTQSQVERFGSEDAATLIGRWREQIDGVATAIEMVNEGRPVFDVHSHEHDLRHALGVPGNRSFPVAVTAGLMMAAGLANEVPVTIEVDGGPTLGTHGPTLRGLTTFEIFRSRLGRRTIDQVRGYDWTPDTALDDPSGLDGVVAVIEEWFAFGPADQPIYE